MSNELLFGLLLLTTSSVILTIYSGFASERGMRQGLYFANGKAMLLGYAGLIAAAILSYTKSGIVSLLIVAGLSVFIISPIVLALLRVNSQLFGLFGFWIGLLISIFVKN